MNGEIYNHRDIRARYAGQYDFQTGSDCEVILALYKDKGIHFLEEISGIFAFVLYDEEKDEFLIARDPIGVIPLYIGKDKDGKIYFGSELKALEGFCDEYEPFLPGHYFYSKEGKMKRWYTREWTDYESVKDNDAKVSEDVYKRQSCNCSEVRSLKLLCTASKISVMAPEPNARSRNIYSSPGFASSFTHASPAPSCPRLCCFSINR